MPAREAILEGRVLRRLHVGPIDFALRPGECVSIGGKSGAGKSVLLRMVADLDPHEGDALLVSPATGPAVGGNRDPAGHPRPGTGHPDSIAAS